MADQDGTTRPKTRPGIKILLAVSLALNLAVAGVVLGALTRGDGGSDRGQRHHTLSAFGAPYMQALSRGERRQILSEIRNDPERPIPDRAARRAMFQDVLKVLRATPFDRDRLAQAVSLQAETTVSVQRSAQRAWLDLVADMSDAERAEYAFAVEENLRRRKPRE